MSIPTTNEDILTHKLAQYEHMCVVFGWDNPSVVAYAVAFTTFLDTLVDDSELVARSRAMRPDEWEYYDAFAGG